VQSQDFNPDFTNLNFEKARSRFDWNKLDSFHVRCQRRILHISWHDFVSNDEVLRRTGLFDVSYVVRKRRLGLSGHVVRL